MSSKTVVYCVNGIHASAKTASQQLSREAVLHAQVGLGRVELPTSRLSGAKPEAGLDRREGIAVTNES
jgi:hypothetical protein